MGREDLLRLSFGDRFNALRDIEFRDVRANICSAGFGNDARLDRILDNYLQIMKQYLGFEIFLNYYLPFKKKSL